MLRNVFSCSERASSRAWYWFSERETGNFCEQPMLIQTLVVFTGLIDILSLFC